MSDIRQLAANVITENRDCTNNEERGRYVAPLGVRLATEVLAESVQSDDVERRSTNKYILEEFERLAKAWGKYETMKQHLDGAKSFAVNLIMDPVNGVYQEEAEGIVERAFQRGFEKSMAMSGGDSCDGTRDKQGNSGAGESLDGASAVV